MTPLDYIPIYAVHDGDEIVGFSFDAEPGNAENHRVHMRINRDDPGAPLLLAGFPNKAEAQAFAAGLAYGGGNECGYVIRFIAPDLTCVLVEFFNGNPNEFAVEDLRTPAQQAGAA